jgi:hypothetical protein
MVMCSVLNRVGIEVNETITGIFLIGAAPNFDIGIASILKLALMDLGISDNFMI